MAKYIMVQGTMSNSGKSFVTAALCRIFHQDGYRTAPFKSQNMALNSFVTEEGLEMGRAQVVQAEAAGIRPCVAMNPILLKPTSHMGSQVIVNGEILGNYSAAEYYKMKKSLIPEIKKALKKLDEEYDIVVIEGAGSPAEINLKENDIVNMGIARLAKAPVLLVGDIDRGGVFASLYGTVKLLDEEEQRMIKGLIINKFRGDVKLLEPGLQMIEEKTDVPVIGVIPMGDIDIEEEDSLAERLEKREKGAGLDVAVIRLPHISNFTDFAVLERMDGISLRYVSQKEELLEPDCLILPGTKNTMADLKWLCETELEREIRRLAASGVPVAGICGGFQMMGKELKDPYGVEEEGEQEGLGLLDCRTVFTREKVRTQEKARVRRGVRGLEALSGQELEGYEIHMGLTENMGGCREFLDICKEQDETGRKESGWISGLCSLDGRVWGAYLHGFFDAPGAAEAFARWAEGQSPHKKAGSLFQDRERTAFSWKEYKEREYDRLADLVRQSVDMKEIYRILETGLEEQQEEQEQQEKQEEQEKEGQPG